ncbi:hypothetical protein ABPG74_019984 [Tetrahymena malaccensis]
MSGFKYELILSNIQLLIDLCIYLFIYLLFCEQTKQKYIWNFMFYRFILHVNMMKIIDMHDACFDTFKHTLILAKKSIKNKLLIISRLNSCLIQDQQMKFVESSNSNNINNNVGTTFTEIANINSEQQKELELEEYTSNLKSFSKIQTIQDIIPFILSSVLASQFKKYLFFGKNLKLFAKYCFKYNQTLLKQSLKNNFHSEVLLQKSLDQIFDEYSKKCCMSSELNCIIRHYLLQNNQFETIQTRKQGYLLLTGGLCMMNVNPKYYQQLQEHPNFQKYTQKAQQMIREQIISLETKNNLDDLHKINEINQGSPQQDSSETLLIDCLSDLKEIQSFYAFYENITSAYLVRNPQIHLTKCQLFILKELYKLKYSENEAFWIFVQIVESILPIDYFSTLGIGLLCHFQISLNISKHLYPKFYQQVNSSSIEINSLIITSLSTLYSNILQGDILYLAWDYIFTFGSKALFQILLVLFEYLSEQFFKIDCQISETKDVENFFKELQDLEDFQRRMNKIEIDEQMLNIINNVYRYEYEQQTKKFEVLYNNDYLNEQTHISSTEKEEQNFVDFKEIDQLKQENNEVIVLKQKEDIKIQTYSHFKLSDEEISRLLIKQQQEQGRALTANFNDILYRFQFEIEEEDNYLYQKKNNCSSFLKNNIQQIQDDLLISRQKCTSPAFKTENAKQTDKIFENALSNQDPFDQFKEDQNSSLLYKLICENSDSIYKKRKQTKIKKLYSISEYLFDDLLVNKHFFNFLYSQNVESSSITKFL